MTRNYGELIAHANIAMLEKLNENGHKPSWEGYSFFDLLAWLEEEVTELHSAIITSTVEEIRREASDVMNYAAMIISKCDTVIKENQL